MQTSGSVSVGRGFEPCPPRHGEHGLRLTNPNRLTTVSDDNRDDSYSLSVDIYSLNVVLSCLVRAPACSWQCGGQGFESP